MSDSTPSVVAFSGSARKDGNTALLAKTVLARLKEAGVRTELVQLAGKPIRGCRKCFERQDRKCAIANDVVNDCIAKMIDADGVILASPTYFADASPEIMSLACRAGMVARANGHLFKRKAGAAVVAVRRAGAIHAFDSLNHFFTISQMIIVGSSYWNIGFGREKGEAKNDAEGLETMRTLGDNMAWLIKKLRG